MAACLVVCTKCGQHIRGADPARMEFRMVVGKSGKLVPLCPPCFEDRRVS